MGYPSQEIEASFKEETNKRKSEVYEIYSKFTEKQLVHGKDPNTAPAQVRKVDPDVQAQSQEKVREGKGN